MNTCTKKKIDSLLEYDIMLKNQFEVLSRWESQPDILTKEELDKVKNLIDNMDLILRIEQKKVEEICSSQLDIELIRDYLVTYYDDTTADSFLFEDNHIERERAYNLIQHYLMEKSLKDDVRIENWNIDNAIYRALENNFIYATNYQLIKGNNKAMYAYMKYGRIFTSPSYAKAYFQRCITLPITPYSYYMEMIQKKGRHRIDETAKEIVFQEINELSNYLFNNATNKKLEDDTIYQQAICYLMEINAYLITLMSVEYIDQTYNNFIETRGFNEDYSMICYLYKKVLTCSKKQVLDYQSKKMS